MAGVLRCFHTLNKFTHKIILFHQQLIISEVDESIISYVINIFFDISILKHTFSLANLAAALYSLPLFYYTIIKYTLLQLLLILQFQHFLYYFSNFSILEFSLSFRQFRSQIIHWKSHLLYLATVCSFRKYF